MRIDQLISETAIASFADVLLLVGPEGSILDANLVASECYGYTRAEMADMNIRDIQVPHGQESVSDRLREAAEQGTPFEVDHRRSDGTLCRVEVHPALVEVDGETALLTVVRDITERKRVEEALVSSEARFRAILEGSPVPMALNDEQGNITFLNRTFTEVFGYSADEIPTLAHWWPVAYPDPEYRRWVAETWEAELERAKRTGEAFSPMKLTVRCKDGTMRTVLAGAASLFGSFEGEHMAVLYDITDRERAEAALRVSDDRLRLALAATNQGLYDLDMRTGIAAVTPEYLSMIGEDPSLAQFDLASFGQRIHPDEAPGVMAIVDAYTRGDTDEYRTEFRIRHTSGEWVWVLSIGRVVERDENGRATRVLGSHTVITERKLAEQALLEGEALHHTILQTALDGFWLLDMQGNLLEVNEAYCRMSGYSAQELLAMHITDLDIAEPADHIPVHMREVKERGGDRFESRHRRKDGSVLDVEISVQYRPTKGGREAAFLRDITERKKLEATLRDMVTSVIDVIGNVSEMRDPYTAGHQRRVSELATVIARDLGMSDADVDDIRVAGLMHDIGKMSVPAEILSKPTALSRMEFALIQGHAEAGYVIIASAHMHEPIAEIVYQHHERCDGSGYPRGLACEELLVGSKVLMVADVVEAMSSHRPYRAALGSDAALAEIELNAGRLYDLEVAGACVRVFRERGFAFSEI